MTAPSRLRVSLAASALIHAVALAFVWKLEPLSVRTPVTVFPLALIGRPAGGDRGGSRGPASEATAPVPEVAPPAPTPEARPAPPPPAARHAARRPRSTPSPAAAAGNGTSAASAAGGGGVGDAGTGSGGGGSGGDGGFGEAGVAYGTNPAPPYPLIAQRLGMEGVVLLEVVVAPDGRASSVRVEKSSGHPPLDAVALETVRTSWRFIPARRDGRPVESRVTVPIRFRLTRG